MVMNWREEKEKKCDEMKEFLIEKNESYGNSAFEPVGIFSTGSAVENLCVRIDDKLSRLMGGEEFAGDDTIKDLCGYLILLMVAEGAK